MCVCVFSRSYFWLAVAVTANSGVDFLAMPVKKKVLKKGSKVLGTR